MSHELRSPLTAILGFAELLESKTSDDDVCYGVGTIKRNGQYLLELINEVLDLSRIEANQIYIEKANCDINQLMHETVDTMSVRAREAGLKLRLVFDETLPAQIHTDGKRVRQILTNLIGNAIKFTPEGQISVHPTFVSGESKSQLLIRVSDTGIGIPEDQFENLFEPFVQLDSAGSGQNMGVGLGLTISRRLARLLDGDLLVESQLDVGSNFTLQLAVPDTPRLPQASDPMESAVGWNGVSLDGVRILLVEDGHELRELFRSCLQSAGAEIQVAENGRVALNRVERSIEKSEPFQMILMDMQMPELDGYQATRMLRDSGFRKPVIALTAYAMNSDRKRCLEAGCDDYAAKPIALKRLLQLVARHAEQTHTATSEPSMKVC